METLSPNKKKYAESIVEAQVTLSSIDIEKKKIGIIKYFEIQLFYVTSIVLLGSDICMDARY